MLYPGVAQDIGKVLKGQMYVTRNDLPLWGRDFAVVKSDGGECFYSALRGCKRHVSNCVANLFEYGL